MRLFPIRRTCAALAALLLAFPVTAHTLQVRAAAPYIASAGATATVGFLVVNDATVERTVALRLSCSGGVVDPATAAVTLGPRGWRAVTARVTPDAARDGAEVVAEADGVSAHTAVLRGIDLTQFAWRRSFVGGRLTEDAEPAAPGIDDRNWPEVRFPTLWQDVGVAWCRVHVTVPAAWRGKRLRVVMGAIDDNDATHFNGERIGRTSGWDTPRDYAIPERLVRWGEENVLTVAVENVNAGGGPYKPPFLLLAGEARPPAAVAVTTTASKRPAPGAIGKPLPLRPMHVDHGVLRWPEGTEVALWGVNFYPQSWYQFETMKRLGVDMRATMKRDLDHLQRMGVEVIRIHVFDREISDGSGNLVRNEHLDLLDELVSECSRRGIYMYFTPIAWWSGPNERVGSFSYETSKPGMMFVPKARAASQAYLRHFLQHVNRFDGRRFVDEPCLCLLEVQNEPAYFDYGDMAGAVYTPQGERPEVLARDRAELRRQWAAWLAEHGFTEDPALYALFRYEQMRRYVHEMVSAIRGAGARQPVAISGFGGGGDEIVQAIADSECDAVTMSAYPGGWERVNDGTNLLSEMGPLAIDPRWSEKARVVYEFDTPAANVSCYLYPAIAAHFRSAEAQVACQFQYDSIATAKWNTDWGAHWLNWLYTPTKSASYMAAGCAFRTLPRGVKYAVAGTELQVGPLASSFAHNNTLFANADTVVHARSIDAWHPVPLPVSPWRIVGTGSSRYVDYTGSGIYVLERVAPTRLRLRVNPDATLVGNSLVGSLAAPAAELAYRPHLFRLLLPGWSKARCVTASGRVLPRVEGGWLVRPGEYRLER